VSWLQLLKLALGIALEEVRAARATDRHVKGPSAVLVTCTRCGARVATTAMIYHQCPPGTP
jgi:hypothetical protein